MTQDKRDLVLGGKSNLPAVIERRTRVANRVLGELKQRDADIFIKNYVEKVKKNLEERNFLFFNEKIYHKTEHLLSYYDDHIMGGSFDEKTHILAIKLLNHFGGEQNKNSANYFRKNASLYSCIFRCND